MSYTFRRLMSDVINPVHDKRHRYGEESIKLYPAGIALIVNAAAGIIYTSHDRHRVYSVDACAALMKASVESVPQNVQETVMFANGGSVYEWQYEEALNVLVASGALTLAQIESAIRTVNEKAG